MPSRAGGGGGAAPAPTGEAARAVHERLAEALSSQAAQRTALVRWWAHLDHHPTVARGDLFGAVARMCAPFAAGAVFAPTITHRGVYPFGPAGPMLRTGAAVEGLTAGPQACLAAGREAFGRRFVLPMLAEFEFGDYAWTGALERAIEERTGQGVVAQWRALVRRTLVDSAERCGRGEVMSLACDAALGTAHADKSI